MPVIAYHLIITCYGFWLPNDPRGSWSDFVRAWELLKFGPATKVSGGRSYARDPHDIARRLEAKKHLSHKPVSRGQWKCYIFDPAYIRNAISYVQRNPLREGMKAQNWSFVTPYNG